MRQIVDKRLRPSSLRLSDIAIAAIELDKTDGPPVGWKDLIAKAIEIADQREAKLK